MNRGDVYWCSLRSPDKRRPVVVLTTDRAIRHLNAVVVASITRSVRHVPSEVLLGPEDGLRSICAVNLHQINTVLKKSLQGRITTLQAHRMSEIRDAILLTLGLHSSQ